MPTVDTNGCPHKFCQHSKRHGVSLSFIHSFIHSFFLSLSLPLSLPSPIQRLAHTHQLKLHWHQAKVDQLHGRPQHIVGLERGHKHVAQLVGDSAAATSLSDSHDCKEQTKAERGVDQLVKDDALDGLAESRPALCNREDGAEEAEPAVLQRRDAEAIGDEAGEALKVEAVGDGGAGAASGDHLLVNDDAVLGELTERDRVVLGVVRQGVDGGAVA